MQGMATIIAAKRCQLPVSRVLEPKHSRPMAEAIIIAVNTLRSVRSKGGTTINASADKVQGMALMNPFWAELAPSDLTTVGSQ